jgi:hypothetical protein
MARAFSLAWFVYASYISCVEALGHSKDARVDLASFFTFVLTVYEGEKAQGRLAGVY